MSRLTDREKYINLLKPEATKYPTMEEIQKMKTPEQIGCNMTHENWKKRKKITEQEVLKEFEANYVYDLYEDKIVLCHITSSQKIVINKNWKLIMSTYYKNNPAPLSFNDIKNIFKFLEVKGWIK